MDNDEKVYEGSACIVSYIVSTYFCIDQLNVKH